MALDLPKIGAYLEGPYTTDLAVLLGEVGSFVDAPAFSTDPDDPDVRIPREPTAILTTPAEVIAAAAGLVDDFRAMLWLLALGLNAIPVAARCYVGDVSGAPVLLVRRLP